MHVRIDRNALAAGFRYKCIPVPLSTHEAVHKLPTILMFQAWKDRWL